MQNKPTIVFLSTFNWKSTLLHREHMLAKQFAKEGYNVSYIELTKQPINLFGLRSRNEGQVRVASFFALPYFRGIFRFIYSLNSLFLKIQLRRVVKSGTRYWIVVSNPNWATAAEAFKKSDSIIVYDMSDDLAEFTTNKLWRSNLLRMERILIGNCNLATVTSALLISKFPKNKPVKLVENGVDAESFKFAKPVYTSNKKIVGYIGGVYDWVDLRLVRRAAAKYPEYQFVIVGPTNKLSEVNDLSKLGNLEYLGEINWREIPNFYASLDLGLLPFVSENIYPRLKTVNSNKVYQYAYFGYPILSTNYTGVKELGEKGIVDVSKDGNDFVVKIGQLLEERNVNDEKRREAFALANSWESRVKQIVDFLDKSAKNTGEKP